MRRITLATSLAMLLWLTTTASAMASGHCADDFVLDQHACEVAHHVPLIAVAGGLTALVALVASGLLDGGAGTSQSGEQGAERLGDGAEPGPVLDGPRVRDAETRPRVAPIDPGLPPPDALPAGVTPMTQDVIDRWAALGADGQGRVFDRHGQQILTIDHDGNVRDLAGREIRGITPEFTVSRFTDADGRTIEYGADGRAQVRVETPAGPRFVPAGDLPAASTVRPDLSPVVRAQWVGAGAGPDGELFGADGRVIGRVDSNGEMRTLTGERITGYAQAEGGRLGTIVLEGGTAVQTGGTGDGTTSGAPATGGGDADLAALVRQTAESQAQRQAAQAADTNVSRPPAAGDTNVRDAGPAGTDASNTGEATRPPAADAPPAPAVPDAPTLPAAPDAPSSPVVPLAPDAPATQTPATPETPNRPAAPDAPASPTDASTRGPSDGATPDAAGTAAPRGASTLGTLLDAQGLIEAAQNDIAAGKPPAEAVVRAVTTTWAGGSVGDVVPNAPDMATSILGSAILPEGVNNVLPDQFAANALGTGFDAFSAASRDLGSTLGGGEVSTAELDAFARRLADRPGADPWAGYARVGELLGEELGDADMDIGTMFGNLSDDLARMYEHGTIGETAIESATQFEQAANAGQYGTVLRGLSEATRAVTDPPDPAQFADDAMTLARVMYEDFTGSGETGGMGPGYWEETAAQVNETVRGVPVLGTVFNGYAEIASGLETQGAGGFATEMAEGAAALASEATAAAADAAASTWRTIAGWF